MIWVGSKWHVLEAAPIEFSTRPVTAFVDGKGSQELLRLLTVMKLHLAYTIGCPQRLHRDWRRKFSQVNHHLVGGVSHSVTTVSALYHVNFEESLLHIPQERPTVSMDMSTLLYDKTPSPPPYRRPAECQGTLSDFQVLDVRGKGVAYPVYHGGGWLPAYPPCHTWVKTPSVYFKPSWAVRPLLRQEYLAIYDWPDRYISRFLDRSHFPALHPVKSLVAGVIQVARTIRGSTGGGTIFSSPPLRDVQAPSTMLNEGSIAVVEDRKRSTTPPVLDRKRARLTDQRDVHTEAEEIQKEVSRENRERKATKSDDAAVPIYLWTEHYMETSSIPWNMNDEVEKAEVEKSMETLRHRLGIWKWKRRLVKEFASWVAIKAPGQTKSSSWVIAKDKRIRNKDGTEFGNKFPTWKFYSWADKGREQYKVWFAHRQKQRHADMVAGADAIQRACRSTWWEWTDGSRPFHWRWPAWYRSTIRDGLDVYLEGDPPRFRMAQRDELDPIVKEQVKKKLNKVRVRRYIAPGHVVSLTSFFSVPKGETDIRMVYDGTKSGLNDAMWVPRFGMATDDRNASSVY